MAKRQFHGIIPAIPTPFNNGKLDVESAGRLLENLKKNGVHGVVVCGSTGEGATVTDAEFETLLKLARETVGKQMPVLAGTGSNSTETTIARCQMAESWGADGLLVVTPYYNKPPQEGLYQHFKTVAASTKLPIMLYNVPGRTACNMLPETVARLADIDNVVAVKEASGSLEQAIDIAALCGDRCTLLSGEDALFLPLLSVGAKGIVTVMGNAVPKEMVALYDAWKRGENDYARKIAYKLRELAKLLFVETNPIPLKSALQTMEIFKSAETRAPLCPISDKLRDKLSQALEQLGALK